MEAQVHELEVQVESLSEEISANNAQLDEMESKLLHIKAEAEQSLTSYR